MSSPLAHFVFTISVVLFASCHTGTASVPEPDPIFDSIDLDATYTAIKKIFARMNLTPKEMAVLIGGGHSSGQSSLEGGTYHGNWVHPMTTTGNGYFQLLTGHKQWCAVRSSDNGNAHFVAKGAATYIAETEYSPMVKHQGQIPCIETGPDIAVFENLPTVPVEDLTYQSGTWHKPSGAAAFLPVDFALQYSNETYVFVVEWARNVGLFYQDFSDAWVKLVENGQPLRCPNVNGPADLEYSSECAERFGSDEAAYQDMWSSVRFEIKTLFDTLPARCNSTRPANRLESDSQGSVCPSSILRLAFHISATYDPTANAIGGSSFANFIGPCAFDDGCAGCLIDAQTALQNIQQRFPGTSLADVTMYAGGLASAYLAEFKLDRIPFHPGRPDIAASDDAACKELGSRLPNPAYQRQVAERAGEDLKKAGMLPDDVPAIVV